MKFGLAGVIICLDQQAARFAVGDAAFEARFQTRASAEDDDGGDFTVLLPSFGNVALRSLYSYSFKADEFHCSGKMSAFSIPFQGAQGFTFRLNG